MTKTGGICEVLLGATPQLRNVGSFDPKKLDPAWKSWLMRAERIFIDKYGGDFKQFFGTIAFEYKKAMEAGMDPEARILEWITDEVAELKRLARSQLRLV